jgi:hypothetical protein
MISFLTSLLTPLMFAFSVIMYLGDFRLLAVGLAATGVASYLVLGQFRSDG